MYVVLHAFDLFPNVQYVSPEDLVVVSDHTFGTIDGMFAIPVVVNLHCSSSLSAQCADHTTCADHTFPFALAKCSG